MSDHALTDQLNYEFSMAECSTPQFENLGRIDLFVCLSGRGTFEARLTRADKEKFQHIGRETKLFEIDTQDTCNRMAYTIKLAARYSKHVGKTIPIYFNGVKEQNEQLREILSKQKNINDYPATGIIIDDIPLDNTVGQCIGLNCFMENHKELFNQEHPALCLVSSTYHIPRVLRTFGMSSPLLYSDFYTAKENRWILDKLPEDIKMQVLEKNDFMQRASIQAFGCDRVITSNPGWEQDLSGEMAAISKYSLAQIPPSIASEIPHNCLTPCNAIIEQSLYQNFISFSFSLYQQKTARLSVTTTTTQNELSVVTKKKVNQLKEI